MRSVFSQSYEHLNNVVVRAKLEEQRSVIKFRGCKTLPPYFSKVAEKFFSAYISHSTFYSWVSQFTEGRTSVRDKSRPGRPAEAVTLQWWQMLRF